MSTKKMKRGENAHPASFRQREEQEGELSTLVLEDAFEIDFGTFPYYAPETLDQLQPEEMKQTTQSSFLLWIPLEQQITLHYGHNQFSPEENKGVCRWIFLEEESPSCHVVLEVYPFLLDMKPFRIDFLVAEWFMLLRAIGQQGLLWIVANPAYDGEQSTISMMEQNEFYQTLLDEYPQRLPLILDPDTLPAFTQRIIHWEKRFILLFTNHQNKRRSEPLTEI